MVMGDRVARRFLIVAAAMMLIYNAVVRRLKQLGGVRVSKFHSLHRCGQDGPAREHDKRHKKTKETLRHHPMLPFRLNFSNRTIIASPLEAAKAETSEYLNELADFGYGMRAIKASLPR